MKFLSTSIWKLGKLKSEKVLGWRIERCCGARMNLVNAVSDQLRYSSRCEICTMFKSDENVE